MLRNGVLDRALLQSSHPSYISLITADRLHRGLSSQPGLLKDDVGRKSRWKNKKKSEIHCCQVNENKIVLQEATLLYKSSNKRFSCRSPGLRLRHEWIWSIIIRSSSTQNVLLKSSCTNTVCQIGCQSGILCGQRQINVYQCLNDLIHYRHWYRLLLLYPSLEFEVKPIREGRSQNNNSFALYSWLSDF